MQKEIEADSAVISEGLAKEQLPLALLRVLATASTQHQPAALAQHVVQQLVAHVPELDGAAVWLWSPAAERFALSAIHTQNGLTVFDSLAMPTWTMRLHEGHVGKAVADKQPLVFSDAAALMHSLWDLDVPDLTALREAVGRIPPTLRVMSLPLLLDDAPVGALDLYSDRSDVPFDLADVSTLQLFAEQLAGLFTLAQRYAELEMQHQRLQAFDAVVTAINDADDIEQTLHAALAATLPIVGVERGMIALVNGGLAQIEAAHNLPFEQAGLHMKWALSDTPLAAVLADDEPVIMDLQGRHPWAALREHGVRSLALVPLVAGTTAVGVLGLASEHDLARQLDWSVVLPIASQIGVAAAHYQLYTLGQRERRQLAGVIASIAEGVLLFDRLGQTVMANQAALAASGGKPVRAGMSLAELTELFNIRWLDGRPMLSHETPVARALEGKVAHNDEVIMRTNDEDTILSLSTAPLLAEDGSINGAVMIFRDVTAQKRHAAVRDEFLAVAAHELRAPLAAIKGYSDLLVKREVQRADATERDRKGIMMLSAQIDHLVRLVDNLLDVSRIDTGRLDLYLQTIDLVALIEVCIERIGVSNINHNIVLNGPPTLEILGDQLRLQQVFTNLLSNAVRYSAPGTDVQVDVWTETSAGADVVGNDGAETQVVVAVRDHGVGIPSEVQGEVFERYYRMNTPLAASGLGLGLYLCREIVTRHGGRITLESTPGQGTTFFITLPLNMQRRANQLTAD